MKKIDVFNLINRLQGILNHKPSNEQMFREVQMMKFKVRPLIGDVSFLDFNNTKLIEVLWSLGKLDDFFHSQFKKISLKDRETFFQAIKQIRGRFEDQLSEISFKRSITTPQLIEMEIFKEHPRRKN